MGRCGRYLWRYRDGEKRRFEKNMHIVVFGVFGLLTDFDWN